MEVIVQMAAEDRWYFSKDQLYNSPSRKSGYDADRELSCRQQAANFIQDMGQRLSVSQLCINTAIVYMHRFYVFHSLASFHRNSMAAAALFLAAKVEEQPRKLEHVIRVAHLCLHRDNPNIDSKSEQYLEQAQDLVFNENVLLQTLGFDVAIDHPHTHVVRCCDLVRASKDLAQTSYFMASNSLHLTTMCLMYKPTVVACFCIHLACKWSNWEIPKSNEGKDWFLYVDKTVTLELLEQLTSEFLVIFDKCPTKLKKKMTSMNQSNSPGFTQCMGADSIQFDDPKKSSDGKQEALFPQKPTQIDKGQGHHPHHGQKVLDFREYKEKKEREKLEKERLEKEKHLREPPPTNHPQGKLIPSSSKSHGGMQSSRSSTSMHKNFQPQHSQQSNIHYNRDNMMMGSSNHYSNQNFQCNNSSKDNSSSYIKHTSQEMHNSSQRDRDASGFPPPYAPGSNIQSNYNAKPQESNNYQNFPHQDSKSRISHQNQYGSNQPLSHHSQSSTSSSSQRDYMTSNQRDNESHHSKDSVRDISSNPQLHRDKDLSERKERDKNRMQYPYGPNSNVTNIKPNPSKVPRDLNKGYSMNESHDRKSEFELPKQNKKYEDLTRDGDNFVKLEQDHFNDFSGLMDKNEMLGRVDNLVKNETKPDIKMEQRGDYYSNIKPNYSPSCKNLPPGHPSGKGFDPKYKSHHHSNKMIEQPQHPFKHEKLLQPPSSDSHKKPGDRVHRRLNEQNQLLSLGGDSKEKPMAPTKVDKGYIKEAVPTKDTHEKHRSSSSADEHKKNKFPPQGQMPSSKSKVKPLDVPAKESNKSLPKLNPEETSTKTLPSNVSKQWNHEFGAPSSLSGTLPDNNSLMSMKTSSIFSPDSKIPAQNVLSSLEKESRKTPDQSFSSPGDSPQKNSSQTNSKKPYLVKTSIFSPPLPKNVPQHVSTNRNRTSSSGSEPELIPVLTKLEDTPGYENIMREKKIAVVSAKSSKHDTATPSSDKKSKDKTDHEQKPYSSSKSGKSNESDVTKESSKSKHQDSIGSDHSLQSTYVKNYLNNLKYPGDMCSDVRAVILPPAQKKPSFTTPSTTVTTTTSNVTTTVSTTTASATPGFTLAEPKFSLSLSTSTVNLDGIEKMVDTSISQSKQNSSFGTSSSLVTNLAPNFTMSTSQGTFGSIGVENPPQPEKNSYSSIPKSVPEDIKTSQDQSGHSSESHKKSEKKKKKEKHKHKDKGKDKSERKKEKKKHKDKDKERDRDRHREKEKNKDKPKETEDAPLKITIPKDKIGLSDTSSGLKIKIAKERLKKESESKDSEASKCSSSGGLKIKISKDVIGFPKHKDEHKGSKKRERSPKSDDRPHSKQMKTSDRKCSKANGTGESARSSSSSHKSMVSEHSIENFFDDFVGNPTDSNTVKTPDYDFTALHDTKQYLEPKGMNHSFQGSGVVVAPQMVESRTPTLSDLTDKTPTLDSSKSQLNEWQKFKSSAAIIDFASEVAGVMPNISDHNLLTFDVYESVNLSKLGDTSNINLPTNANPSADAQLTSHLAVKNTIIKEVEHISSNDVNAILPNTQIIVHSDDFVEKHVTQTSVIHRSAVESNQFKSELVHSFGNEDILKNYSVIVNRHSRPPYNETRIDTTSVADHRDSSLRKHYVNKKESNTNQEKFPPFKTHGLPAKNNPNYYNKYFNDSSSSFRLRGEERKTFSRYEEKRCKQFYSYNSEMKANYNDRFKHYEQFRQKYDNQRQEYYNEGECGDNIYFNTNFEHDHRKRQHCSSCHDYSCQNFHSNSANRPGYNEFALQNTHDMNYRPVAYNETSHSFENNFANFSHTNQSAVMSMPNMMQHYTANNMQYQQSFYSNYPMYPNGNYPVYNNSTEQMFQPCPPGTLETLLNLEAPPLPDEPPPDLPPPPQTPPPP